MTEHARQRMAQRGIRFEQIEYVLSHGKVYDRAGATWFVLRRKDVPKTHLIEDWVDKVVGVVLCIESDRLSTVYRRERPSLHIRKKSKHGRLRSRRGESEI